MIAISGTTIGLLLGMVGCLIYVARGYRSGAYTPNLSQAAVLLLACMGVPAGAQCGYLAFTATPDELGVFKDQTIAIVLGAIAMIWVSIQQIWEVMPLPNIFLFRWPSRANNNP